MSEKLMCFKCNRTENKELPEARDKLSEILKEITKMLDDPSIAIVKISAGWDREIHRVPKDGWMDGEPCKFTDHYLKITTYR